MCVYDSYTHIQENLYKILMYPNPHKYESILLKLIFFKKIKHI